MDKRALIGMIKTEENTENIYDLLTNASKEELRDIAFECLCCIKIGTVEVEDMKSAMLEDITNNLTNIAWKEDLKQL